MKPVLCGVALFYCAQLVQANSMIVPAANATAVGDSGETFGFNDTGVNLQFVYRAQNFSAPVVITGMAFRPDEVGRSSMDMVIPTFSLRLTTYQNGPANLNADYAQNKTADDTLVFSASVHWVGSGLFRTQPNPFLMPVTFSKPFYYDPRQGDLLMKMDSPGANNFLTATLADASLDGAAGYTYSGGALGHGSSPFVLVTEFSTTAVPEPRSIVLFSVFAVLVLYRGKMKMRER